MYGSLRGGSAAPFLGVRTPFSSPLGGNFCMTWKRSTWSAEEQLPLWPRPQAASSGKKRTAVLPAAARPIFLHSAGCCRELLTSAFRRAEATLFNLTTELPHLRVRVPGVRESATADLDSCAAGSAETSAFGALVVHVHNDKPTPLGLGMDESYTLELGVDGSDGTLMATSEWGVLRGIESFVQLAQWDGSRRVLCALPLTVHDSPAYSHRGVLLDTARHFYPLETAVLPLLDGMAALKLNVLHWHLADAHSVPLGSTALASGALHPSLTYSAADMRAVVAAAFERGIRVVPELDMPAHTGAWAFGLPEAVVTCPKRVTVDVEGLEHGVNKAALHPLREATYEAVSTLLHELAAIFPDEYLHLGGDEVDGECWLSDADIRTWASQYSEQQQQKQRTGRNRRRHPFPPPEWTQALQAQFTRRVGRLAASVGKRVVMWDEALEVAELLEDGPLHGGDDDDAAGDEAQASLDGGAATFGRTDVTIDVWRDWIHGRRQRALHAGHDVVWSSLKWYLDLPGNTWEEMYQVELPAATVPATAMAASSATHSGAAQLLGGGRLLGGETSSWSEHADPTNLMQRVLTRAAAVAERLWSGPPSHRDVARQRLAAVRCRLVQRGLHAEPVMPDHCEPPRWSLPRHRRDPNGSAEDADARHSSELGAIDEQPACASSASNGLNHGANSIPRVHVERLLAQAWQARGAKPEAVEGVPSWSKSTASTGALTASILLNAMLMYAIVRLVKRTDRLSGQNSQLHTKAMPQKDE